MTPELQARGPLELVDGALLAVRRGGFRAVAAAWVAGVPLCLAALVIYYLERVEGVRGARAGFALMLVLGWYARALVLCRVARHYALLLRPTLPVALERPRAVDVVCTASVAGAGLWVWLWPLAGFAMLSPHAPAAFLLALCARGAVAPSWLARAGTSSGRGAAAFGEAINDTSGMRGIFTIVELLALGGILLLFANVYAAISMLLLLSHSMLGLNVAFVKSFVSPDNVFSLLLVTSLTLVFVEPLRAALSAQAFVDARSRRDGADLHSAVDAVLARAGRRVAERSVSSAAALLLAAAIAVPAAARAQSAVADDELVRGEVQNILSGDEFREFAEHDHSSLSEWLERIIRWLNEQPEDDKAESSPPPTMPDIPVEVLMVLALIAIALIVAYVASQHRAAVTVDSRAAVADQAQVDKEPEVHLDDAARLAAAGDPRAALRALYLAMLATLDRARLIDYESSRTNWQYIRTMPRGEPRKLFAAFTRVFDRKWYGHEPTTLEEYERARAVCERIHGLLSRSARPLDTARVAP